MSEKWPSIPEFFAGRALFITGATGFMGKVLVEKLLRSCPDVRAIYLLVRTKKGAAPETRLRELTKQSLFDRLRAENPAAFDKLRAVAGDVIELGLGLSPQDRAELQAEVSVVFHSAATVRFDECFRDAVLVNVRGTRDVLELALGMRQLVALVHLSTAFSNTDRVEAGEQLYPAPGDWKKMIQLAERDVDDNMIVNCLSTKVVGRRPNMYTYVKALAEHAVNDFRSRLPVVVVRPSIVISAAREPYCGWVDNFNGPMGLWVGGLTGVLGMWSLFQEDNLVLDYVPVDVAIKSVICIAWHTALEKPSKALDLYNCSSMMAPITQKEFILVGIGAASRAPPMQSVWYPSDNRMLTTNWKLVWFSMAFFHLLPGYLMDAALKYNGKKPMFAKLYRRIYTSMTVLAPFGTKAFKFPNERFLAIGACVKPEDQTDFGFTEVVSWQDGFTLECVKGLRRSLLNDPVSTIPKAKSRMRRLFWLDRCVKGVFWLALFYVGANNAAVQAVFTKSLSTLNLLG